MVFAKRVKNTSNESVDVTLASGVIYKIAPNDELKNMELSEASAHDSRLTITRDLGEVRGNY
jgi:hypothetical protein